MQPQTPRPPANPGSLAEQLKEQIRDAVAGGLAEARAAVQEELARATAERAQLRLERDAATRGSEREAIDRALERLDTRIEKLQGSLEKLNRQLTTQDGPRVFTGVTTTPPTPRFPPVDRFDPAPMVISVVGIIFVGFPIALALTRLLWKRATNAPPAAMTAAQNQRFDHLQQSVEAIAIEVERISENQRYLTRLLAEPKQNASVGGGPRS